MPLPGKLASSHEITSTYNIESDSRVSVAIREFFAQPKYLIICVLNVYTVSAKSDKPLNFLLKGVFGRRYERLYSGGYAQVQNGVSNFAN